MWAFGALAAAALLAGQQAPAAPLGKPGEPPPAAQDEADDWGMSLYAQRPRLSLAQRLDRDCAPAARGPDESEAACRERVTEAVIQESLSRGDAASTAPQWTEAEERQWVRAGDRPIDRLRDCRTTSGEDRDGQSASWSLRCGDQDGPAAEALDRLLSGD